MEEIRLRDGIDKVHLTIKEKQHKTYAYPREIAMMYSDRLSKLKFSDRYAIVINLQKYPWKTWRYQGEDKSTYAVEYFLRLDGMRQMRVFLNCMRLYNIQHGLPLYKQRLFDDNVVIPSHSFDLSEFVTMVQAEIPKILSDYVKIRNRVFQDTVIKDDLEVNTHQLEVVIEGIGLHTSDVSDTFKDFARCDSFKVYHDHTNTHYLNTSGRRQLKIYQKGVGILRLEATFNERPQDIIFNWKQDVDFTVDSIRAEMDDIFIDMKIPNDWYTKRSISKDKLVWLIANSLGLREKGRRNGAVQTDLMKILLTITSWSSNRDTRELTRRLVRKGLLEATGRGSYIPTEELRIIQEMFIKLERMEMLENELQPEDTE